MIPPYNPNLPVPPNDQYLGVLNRALGRLFREMATRLDTLAYGHIEGVKAKGTASPTTGIWTQGDFYKNTNPSELGSAGSKYVLLGWICTVGGEPGTWLEARVLTGN